jgi:hypothetical protein
MAAERDNQRFSAMETDRAGKQHPRRCRPGECRSLEFFPLKKPGKTGLF